MIKLLSHIYHWLTDETCHYCNTRIEGKAAIVDGLDEYCSSACWYSKCDDDDIEHMKMMDEKKK